MAMGRNFEGMTFISSWGLFDCWWQAKVPFVTTATCLLGIKGLGFRNEEHWPELYYKNKTLQSIL